MFNKLSNLRNLSNVKYVVDTLSTVNSQKLFSEIVKSAIHQKVRPTKFKHCLVIIYVTASAQTTTNSCKCNSDKVAELAKHT